jgi:ammonia channel protein AmtB
MAAAPVTALIAATVSAAVGGICVHTLIVSGEGTPASRHDGVVVDGLIACTPACWLIR